MTPRPASPPFILCHWDAARNAQENSSQFATSPPPPSKSTLEDCICFGFGDRRLLWVCPWIVVSSGFWENHETHDDLSRNFQDVTQEENQSKIKGLEKSLNWLLPLLTSQQCMSLVATEESKFPFLHLPVKTSLLRTGSKEGRG